MNSTSQFKKQLVTNFLPALVVIMLLITWSCNEERIYPTPLPTGIKITTLGYSGINGRIGAGDFVKDTLLLLTGIPADGQWSYNLNIGEFTQQGVVDVINSNAIFANFLRLEWWLQLQGDDTDSVVVTIELVSETLGYEVGTFSCKFKKEMYDIRTWQDLQAMEYDLEGEYTIKNNIQFPQPTKEKFPEQGFRPIGGDKGINNAFKGKLLGDGYTLIDFYINREFSNFVGLFGVLSYSAEVRNLKIELSDLGVKGYDYVGALAGYANKNTIIEDCKAEGNVYGNNYTGGLVGYLGDNSVISLSRMTGTVSGAAFTGGLIGYCTKGSNIEYCFSKISLSGTDSIGGLIGVSFGKLNNCQVDSALISGESCVGGLIGWSGGTLNNCSVAAGSVVGDNAVGGLIGTMGSTGSIFKSCCKANVNGNTIAGGLIGLNLGEVENCYASGGQVQGSAFIGGLLGQSENNVKNCYSNTMVGNCPTAGGFIGTNKGTVLKCYWNEDLNASIPSVGTGDSNGIEKKTGSLFTSFDPSVGGVREIFLGWDYTETWAILNSKNNGFPYLYIERELSI